MKKNLLALSFISFLFMGCSKEEDDINYSYAGKYRMLIYNNDHRPSISGSMDITINKYANHDVLLWMHFYEKDSVIELYTYIKDNNLYNKDGDEYEGSLLRASNKDLILLRDNTEYYFHNVPLNE